MKKLPKNTTTKATKRIQTLVVKTKLKAGKRAISFNGARQPGYYRR